MKEKKVTFSLRNLRKKTPLILFKIGSGLLGVSTIITSYEVAQGDYKIGLISLILGSVGKFITELFAHQDLD